MDFLTLFEMFGDKGAIALVGLAVGLGFGAFAQRSRFCMRSALIEFARGAIGANVAVWLVAFAAAIAFTQGFISSGLLNVSEARQLTGQGSLSGAVIGGLMFGAGMILARGCASRLLVLSATGNLRALVSGLILTIVAQASLRGGLSPAREWLAGLWTVSGEGARDVQTLLRMDSATPLLIGFGLLALGIVIAVRNRAGHWRVLGGLGIGAMITR